GDGAAVRPCAVVSNAWATDGQALREWQRGKAGTIAHVNYVLQAELAAGVYPSAQGGAGAAEGHGAGAGLATGAAPAAALGPLHAVRAGGASGARAIGARRAPRVG